MIIPLVLGPGFLSTLLIQATPPPARHSVSNTPAPRSHASRASLDHEANAALPANSPTFPTDYWADELRALKALARKDPAAAVAEAMNFATKEERDEALIAVCYQIAEHDPALALRTAWQIQHRQIESPSDGTAFEHLARKWAEKDLPGAMEWTAKQPINEYDTRRDRIVKNLTEVYAATAPEEAARLVTSEIRPGHVQEQAMVSVLKQWALQDEPSK